MNLFIVVVLALVLPSAYLAREIGNQENLSSPRDTFIFPKDRKSDPNSRIIGGDEVTPHSYPFQAALLIYTRSEVYFCGGTLINQRYVLTAAHCVDTSPNPALFVLVSLGAHDISATETNSIVYNSTEWVRHSGWNANLLQNDVAVIKLPSRVALNDYIQTVVFANGTDTYENVSSTAVGWGRTETSTSVSNVLRHVDSTTLSNTACGAAHPDLNALLVPTHLCISGEGIRGTCSGDSGGPLLVNGVQVGITSFGFTNCVLGMPSVFTRVTEFSDWIEENARDGASSFENLYYSLIVSVVLSVYHLSKSM